MLGVLINLVIVLLICGVVFWAVQQLLPLVPMPEPFARVIYVLLVVIMAIVVISLLAGLLGAGTGPFPRWRLL